METEEKGEDMNGIGERIRRWHSGADKRTDHRGKRKERYDCGSFGTADSQTGPENSQADGAQAQAEDRKASRDETRSDSSASGTKMGGRRERKANTHADSKGRGRAQGGREKEKLLRSHPLAGKFIRLYQTFLLFFFLSVSVVCVTFLALFQGYQWLEKGGVLKLLQSDVTAGAKPLSFSAEVLRRTVYFSSAAEAAAVFWDDTGNNSLLLPPSLPYITGDEPITELPPPQDEETMSFETLYSYDRSAVPKGAYPIVPLDLSGSPSEGELLMSNYSGLDLDLQTYLDRAYPIEPYVPSEEGEPLVLILHTHGTEAYADTGMSYFTAETDAPRSRDITKNVVAVGNAMAKVLRGAGIPTLHCETMFDEESYTESYDNAAVQIRAYLKEYPSIRYVFDVHRDAIIRENGDRVRPVTLVDGESCAQIMILAGTNAGGADFPFWEDNLTVGVHLQNRLNTSYIRFARPINIRAAAFNQKFANGSLLFEVGSCGNTLEEAVRAGEHLAASIAELILGQ